MYATAHNASDSPVVIDAEGRTIEGGGFGTVDTTADEVKDLAEDGVLHIFPELQAGPGQSEEAEAAIAQTTAVRERAARLNGYEKDDLIKLAGKAGINEPNELHKDELETRLAFRTDFDDASALEDIRAEEDKPKRRSRSQPATSSAGAGPGAGNETEEG